MWPTCDLLENLPWEVWIHLYFMNRINSGFLFIWPQYKRVNTLKHRMFRSVWYKISWILVLLVHPWQCLSMWLLWFKETALRAETRNQELDLSWCWCHGGWGQYQIWLGWLERLTRYSFLCHSTLTHLVFPIIKDIF